MRYSALAAIGVLVLGCTVSELELEGRRCPCVEGWTCDEARDRCVRSSGADAGGMDAARPPDAGSGSDAGAVRDGRIGEDGQIGEDGGSDAGPAPDAGAPDGASPDARVDPDGGAPSACDDVHAGALFCSGFEDPSLSEWDDTEIVGAGATVGRVTDVVYRGAAALRAATPTGTEVATIHALVFPSSPPPDQWLRAYFYFPSSASLTIEYMAMRETRATSSLVAAAWGGESDFHAHGFAGGVSERFPMVVPRDRWLCVELHVAIDASAGAIEIFWDGTLMADRTGLDTTAAGGLGRIYVGVDYRVLDDPMNVVYVDEVVADTARVGCDPP